MTSKHSESMLVKAFPRDGKQRWLDISLPTNKYGRRLIMVVTLLLAALLRFFQLDSQSMWFDEAARMVIARADLSTILLTTGGDTLPPFFHTTIHFWLKIGEGDFWLRLLPALASLALVATMQALAQASYNFRTAVISGFLLAIFPYQIFLAQQANLYSFLALFSGLQILLFWLAVSRNRKAYWIGYGFVAVIAWYTHYFGALITLTLNLWLILVLMRRNEQRSKFQWRSLLLADAVIILLSLPGILHLLDGASDVASNFWLTQPSLVAPLGTLFLFLMSYTVPSPISGVAFLVAILMVFLAIFELIYSARRRPDERPALWLLLLLTFLPMMLVLLASFVVPLYLDRTLIIISPAYALLLGRALATTRRKSPLPYLAGVAMIILLISVGSYYWDSSFYKPDYRAASAYVASQMRVGEAVVHTGNGSYIPFLHYQGAEDHFLLDGDPAPHHPPDLHEIVGGRAIELDQLQGYDRFWLIVALEHSVQYQQQAAAAIEEKYPLLQETTIDEITIQQYQLSTN